MSKVRIQRERQNVTVSLTFDSGNTHASAGVLQVDTRIIIDRTLDGVVHETEGTKQRTVLVRDPVSFELIGKTATMTLDTGGTWRVFPKNGRTLIETSA